MRKPMGHQLRRVVLASTLALVLGGSVWGGAQLFVDAASPRPTPSPRYLAPGCTAPGCFQHIERVF